MVEAKFSTATARKPRCKNKGANLRKRRSIRKPEPVDVRGMCAVPGCTNPQVSNGKGKFKAVCNAHHRIRTKSQYAYLAFRHDSCDHCGFIPVHPCQLECDHIDGNHNNNDECNIQTLCANCHKLKSFLCGDYTN